ncbi:c-type cytochrome [Marinomonas sp. 2405UD68-3]|uniref:c-type cytochrome n=1 Tax=Marinomonas sp. 2405UD68-3 TaxID=3391835 RepID=UPI0039C96291
MNKRLNVLSITLAALALSAGSLSAADVDKSIEMRQSYMQLIAFNVGIVGSMAKGKTEYDSTVALQAANNLDLLSKINYQSMWPEGSSNTDYNHTRAKEKIWSDAEGFATKHTNFANSAQNLVNLADKGLNNLRVGMKELGGSCGGCHQGYRTKK